jgi:hypothetical protein
MKYNRFIKGFSFILLIICLTSCSITKRRYLPGYYFNSTSASTSTHKITVCKRNKIAHPNHFTTSLNNSPVELNAVPESNNITQHKPCVTSAKKINIKPYYSVSLLSPKALKDIETNAENASMLPENSNSDSRENAFWRSVVVSLAILSFILFQSFFILVVAIQHETFSEYWWTILIGFLFYGGATFCIYAGILMGSLLLGLGILLFVLALFLNFAVLYICLGTEC